MIWPLVLIALAWLWSRGARGHPAGRAFLAGGLALVIVLPSLAYAFHLTATQPSQAFFVTPTRLWELGIGALVALGATRWQRLPLRAGQALVVAGLAVVATGLFVQTAETTWPAPGALVPVLGTALVIAGGFSAGHTGAGRLLGNPAFVWIGGLSYSLYLWHWPALRIATWQFGELSTLQGLVVVHRLDRAGVAVLPLRREPGAPLARHQRLSATRPVDRPQLHAGGRAGRSPAAVGRSRLARRHHRHSRRRGAADPEPVAGCAGRGRHLHRPRPLRPDHPGPRRCRQGPPGPLRQGLPRRRLRGRRALLRLRRPRRRRAGHRGGRLQGRAVDAGHRRHRRGQRLAGAHLHQGRLHLHRHDDLRRGQALHAVPRLGQAGLRPAHHRRGRRPARHPHHHGPAQGRRRRGRQGDRRGSRRGLRGLLGPARGPRHAGDRDLRHPEPLGRDRGERLRVRRRARGRRTGRPRPAPARGRSRR